jgi:hypothetical protein
VKTINRETANAAPAENFALEFVMIILLLTLARIYQGEKPGGKAEATESGIPPVRNICHSSPKSETDQD